MRKLHLWLALFVRGELFYKNGHEFSRIKRDGTQLQVYGRDGYITINGSDVTEHWQESTQRARTECIRSAILASPLCRNFIQFVQQMADLTLFCGTDAAFQTCYILKDGEVIKQFSGNHLVGFEPGHYALMEIVKKLDNELIVISAAPKSLNENAFGVYLSRIELNGEESEIKLLRQTAESTFRGHNEFFTSLSVDNHFIFVGRELSGNSMRSGKYASNGFAYHVCSNDPGLFSEPSQWLSGATASLTCCKNNFCYPNLMDARLATNNNQNAFLFGLFKAEYGSTTAVCVFTKRDLLDHFKHSPYKMSSGASYGVKDDKGRYRHPNDCSGYAKVANMHERVSRFVTENTPLVVDGLNGQLIHKSPFPTKLFDVSVVNDGVLLLLVGDEMVQKNTVIHKNNTFVVNHNLEFASIGNNVTDVRIVVNKVITIQHRSIINKIEISRCDEYVTCAACIAIGDILCGWDSVENRCAEVQGQGQSNSNLIQEVESPATAINKVCQVTTDKPISFTRKDKEAITIATQTTHIPIFDHLTWKEPDGAVIEQNDNRFFHSYQPKVGKALLVVYPNQDRPDGIDGTYYLEYKIRDIVIHVSTFDITFDSAKATEKAPEVETYPTEEVVTEDTDSLVTPNTASSSFVVMMVIVALCVIVIALFIFIMVRYNGQKRDGDEKRIHLQYKRSQLRGQPSGESINDQSYNELNNRKGDLCEVVYDSAFVSRQSPNHPSEMNNLRDGDGQSESRSEKDNSDVFISCPSQAASLSSGDQSQSDQAVILFPDGTIKRIKTKTMERLKSEMHDITTDPESEKFIQGTLRKTFHHKHDSAQN